MHAHTLAHTYTHPDIRSKPLPSLAPRYASPFACCKCYLPLTGRVLQGFPGTVDASVTYTVTEDNELIIEFEATTDAPTPIGMTQHSYFNLDVPGDDKTVLDHVVFINAYVRNLMTVGA